MEIKKRNKSDQMLFRSDYVMVLNTTGARWLNELSSWTTLQLVQAYYQNGVGSRPAL